MTAVVVGLNPSIAHEVGLRALREALNKRDNKIVPAEELLKMAESVLKSNSFKFNNKTKQHILGTTIGINLPHLYVCIFMSNLEVKFFFCTNVYKRRMLRTVKNSSNPLVPDGLILLFA